MRRDIGEERHTWSVDVDEMAQQCVVRLDSISLAPELFGAIPNLILERWPPGLVLFMTRRAAREMLEFDALKSIGEGVLGLVPDSFFEEDQERIAVDLWGELRLSLDGQLAKQLTIHTLKALKVETIITALTRALDQAKVQLSQLSVAELDDEPNLAVSANAWRRVVYGLPPLISAWEDVRDRDPATCEVERVVKINVTGTTAQVSKLTKRLESFLRREEAVELKEHLQAIGARAYDDGEGYLGIIGEDDICSSTEIEISPEVTEVLGELLLSYEQIEQIWGATISVVNDLDGDDEVATDEIS